MMIEFADDDGPAATLAALEREVVEAAVGLHEAGKQQGSGDTEWFSEDVTARRRSGAEAILNNAVDTLLAARAAQSPPADSKEDRFQ